MTSDSSIATDLAVQRANFMSISIYMFTSSVMLVINKVVITQLPVPGLVITLQLAGTVLCMYAMKLFGLIHLDALDWEKAGQYLPVGVGFVVCLYANTQTMVYANVELLIMFKAVSPMLLSVLDYVFLGRELPSRLSAFALILLAMCAVGYVHFEHHLETVKDEMAFAWGSIYLVVMVFDMILGKALVSTVQFESPVWGSAFYSNLLGLPFIAAVAVTSGEVQQMQEHVPSVAAILWLLLSMVFGISLAWAAWNCRNDVSATHFSLVGLSCKFVSIIINCSVWNKHASFPGLVCLALGLLASFMVQQSPMREAANGPQEESRSHKKLAVNQSAGNRTTVGVIGSVVVFGLLLLHAYHTRQELSARHTKVPVKEFHNLMPRTGKNLETSSTNHTEIIPIHRPGSKGSHATLTVDSDGKPSQPFLLRRESDSSPKHKSIFGKQTLYVVTPRQGMNCQEACEARGYGCDDESLRGITSPELLSSIAAAANASCAQFKKAAQTTWGGPWLDRGDCYYVLNQSASCSLRPQFGEHRICACLLAKPDKDGVDV